MMSSMLDWRAILDCSYRGPEDNRVAADCPPYFGTIAPDCQSLNGIADVRMETRRRSSARPARRGARRRCGRPVAIAAPERASWRHPRAEPLERGGEVGLLGEDRQQRVGAEPPRARRDVADGEPRRDRAARSPRSSGAASRPARPACGRTAYGAAMVLPCAVLHEVEVDAAAARARSRAPWSASPRQLRLDRAGEELAERPGLRVGELPAERDEHVQPLLPGGLRVRGQPELVAERVERPRDAARRARTAPPSDRDPRRTSPAARARAARLAHTCRGIVPRFAIHARPSASSTRKWSRSRPTSSLRMRTVRIHVGPPLRRVLLEEALPVDAVGVARQHERPVLAGTAA